MGFHHVKAVLDLFQRPDVSLIPVAESLDTGSASGRLVLNIMVSVSQWEREAIGERTRDAMQRKIKNLEWVGGLCRSGRTRRAARAEVRRPLRA
jgi:DNA invertase Pin-like site-specific DNA recombinase